MKNRMRIAFCLLIFAAATMLFASASGEVDTATGESAATATRGRYLAGQGIIVPPDEIYIDSYIAGIDYRYPVPPDGVGITVYSGHRQISTSGQEEVIQIGIQAGKTEFENLPPMNLAFVIDKSSSMNQANKMDWVKEAFDIFIVKVRDIDFVSLITFDNEANVIYRSTQMNSDTRRMQFKDAVHSISPGGGTNLVAGLQLGYEQVMANFRSEYTNRVLFLTDGVGESAGILEMAESYKEIGANVSTIGVGTNFDLHLMRELAKKGGGSSRFISDREEMEETFGSELDRMVVPSARDLDMVLHLPEDVQILGTWGYNNRIRGNTITYSQATLHHGDYETILVHVRIPPGTEAGTKELARFSLTYKDLEGDSVSMGPFAIEAEFVKTDAPVTGFSSGMVLKSGTMLHLARNMITIGELYYSCQENLERVNTIRDGLWESDGGSEEVVYENLTNEEIRQLEDSIASKMRRAMELTAATKKELYNARLRLDNEGFDDEIEIMDNYIKILGKELEMEQDRVAQISNDVELSPPVAERSLYDNIQNLFSEIALSMGSRDPGIVAISGFSAKEGIGTDLLDFINEMALVEIARHDTLKVVERGKLSAVIEEQKLSLSGLMDTTKAIEVGKLLSANYILTGTVIEMSTSVVIFSRIINVESGEVEAAAQVIVARNEEVNQLLA